jgi:imidazolonepropionase
MGQSMNNYSMQFDLLIKNARIFTMDEHFNFYECASVGIKHRKIVWIGEDTTDCNAKDVLNVRGALLTPGLIDCHTHLIYAGHRGKDFAARLEGKSYTEIAQDGGGILSTVNATQSASLETLLELAYKRAHVMLLHGTTTIEVKSGYGLDVENELKMLRVAKLLQPIIPMRVIPTFLALHALPKGVDNKDDYVHDVIHDILPKVAHEELACAVDAFCENIAFSAEHVSKLFHAAQQLKLNIKLHAEQLSDQKGARMAAELNALSVDHIEYLKPDDCIHLANGKTVAVLLPGAFYYLREQQKPPVQELRMHNIPMAIATDHNPGTSPFLSLPLMMNMACILFGLTVKEAWLGVTAHAAKALDIHHTVGMIKQGMMADLVVWDCHSLEDIIMQPNINYCRHIIYAGKRVTAARLGI